MGSFDIIHQRIISIIAAIHIPDKNNNLPLNSEITGRQTMAPEHK